MGSAHEGIADFLVSLKTRRINVMYLNLEIIFSVLAVALMQGWFDFKYSWGRGGCCSTSRVYSLRGRWSSGKPEIKLARTAAASSSSVLPVDSMGGWMTTLATLAAGR